MITHQIQPNPYACNQTCLAMLLGVPVEEVLKVFPGDGMSTRELYDALDRCRFLWNAFIFGTLVCDGVYLMTVPSLNFEGGGHTILVEQAQRLIVYDPNRGREGKKFYSNEGDGVGVPLRHWSEVILVLPGGKLPQQQAA